MEGAHDRELHAVDVDRAALVRARQLVVVDALLAQPTGQLDDRNDGGAVLLRDVDGVADVVAVPVRDRDDVRPLGLALVLGALRVPVQERVDVDALSARRVESEGGVPEPGQSGVSHGAEANNAIPF